MKKDYLKLTNGREVRILWNMNASGEFTATTGMELTDLAKMKADMNTLRSIAWCSAREGEDAEGGILELDEKQFGRLIDMNGIVEFSKILSEQSKVAAQKKSEAPTRSPRIFFRRKG